MSDGSLSGTPEHHDLIMDRSLPRGSPGRDAAAALAAAALAYLPPLRGSGLPAPPSHGSRPRRW
ncbi:hypothetical protein FAGKG844_10013 [Frankia sp. AgKG'84/4]